MSNNNIIGKRDNETSDQNKFKFARHNKICYTDSSTQEELAEQVSWQESPPMDDSPMSESHDHKSKSFFSTLSFSPSPNVGTENDSVSKSSMFSLDSIFDSGDVTPSPDIKKLHNFDDENNVVVLNKMNTQLNNYISENNRKLQHLDQYQQGNTNYVEIHRCNLNQPNFRHPAYANVSNAFQNINTNGTGKSKPPLPNINKIANKIPPSALLANSNTNNNHLDVILQANSYSKVSLNYPPSNDNLKIVENAKNASSNIASKNYFCQISDKNVCDSSNKSSRNINSETNIQNDTGDKTLSRYENSHSLDNHGNLSMLPSNVDEISYNCKSQQLNQSVLNKSIESSNYANPYCNIQLSNASNTNDIIISNQIYQNNKKTEVSLSSKSINNSSCQKIEQNSSIIQTANQNSSVKILARKQNSFFPSHIQENSNVVIDRRHSTNDPVKLEPKKTSTVLPNYSSIAYQTSTLQVKNSSRQSYPIDNYNNMQPLQSSVELVSEDVMSVLEELEKKAMESVNRTRHVTPNSAMETTILSVPTHTDSSMNNEIIVTQAEMDMFEELERQALRQLNRSDNNNLKKLNCSDDFFTAPTQSVTDDRNFNRNAQIDYNSVNGSKLKYLRLEAVNVITNNKTRCKVITSSKISHQIEPRNTAKFEYIVSLTDQWYDTEIMIQDIFHVIFITKNDLFPTIQKLESNMIHNENSKVFVNISSEEGLIILNPDILISPTRIADACNCMRRCVLSEKVKSIGGLSAPAVLGNLKHTFIEALLIECVHNISSRPDILLNEIISSDKVEEMICKSIECHRDDLNAISQSDSEVIFSLQKMVDPMKKWVYDMYYSGYDINNEKSHIQSIESTEESIWSPLLGIKGQLDVITSIKPKMMRHGMLNYTYNIPLELKSGNWKSSTASTYRAQVILYIIILMIRSFIEITLTDENDVFPSDSFHGLLLYINEEIDNYTRLEIIRPKWIEIQSLLINRNSLSFYLSKSMNSSNVILPPLLRKTFDCEYCYQSAECMVYHQISSITNESNSNNYSIIDGPEMINNLRNSKELMYSTGVPELYVYHMKDISTNHVKYYKLWDHLIFLESKAMTSKQIDLWSKSCLIRERDGYPCRGGYYLDIDSNDIKESCLNQYTLKFNRYNTIDDNLLELSESKPVFNIGDRVIISIERTNKNNNYESNIDIEDIVDANLSHQLMYDNSNIGYIEPNLAIGHIVLVNNNVIHVEIGSYPRRLLKICKRLNNLYKINQNNESYVRFDRDDISIGINTMRANIMELLIDGHNQKEYKAIKPIITNYIREKENNLDNANQLNKIVNHHKLHLRRLIIDLFPPSIKEYNITADNAIAIKIFELFCPKNISFNRYIFLILLLNKYLSNKYDNILIDLYKSYNGLVDELDTSLIYLDKYNNICLSDEIIIYSGCNPFDLYESYLQCNEEQRNVIKNVINSKDYSLIQGLPGTGKSTTLSLLTRILISKQEKVLLTSYTHSAIDNLLLKLIESNISKYNIMRLGNHSAVHTNVSSYLSTNLSLNESVSACRLLVCTVLAAARENIVHQFDADFCIIDEAGQITQPVIIGSLLYCKVFVLVGDDRQLKPLVTSSEAISLGMDISLFQRLAEAHPSIVLQLSTQYRMNDDIMYLCNNLIYNNQMTCGNESIATSRFVLPTYIQTNVSWLDICTSIDRSVIFLNTDNIENDKVEVHNNMNINEVIIVKHITWILRKCDYDMKQLGIISPYRLQVHAIKEMLQSYHNYHYNDILETNSNDNFNNINQCEVSTIDKYQGRDMEAIIFSTVRSKDEENSSELLQDWRRINVAITRSKRKLILIGSVISLSKIPLLKDLITLLSKKNWIINLNNNDINKIKFSNTYFNDNDQIL